MNSSLRWAVLAFLVLALSPLQAQVVFSEWLGGTTGEWLDSGSWSNGVPNNTGTIALFATGITLDSIAIPNGTTTFGGIDVDRTAVTLTGTSTAEFNPDFIYIYNTSTLTLALLPSDDVTVSEQLIVGYPLLATGDVLNVTGSGTLTVEAGGFTNAVGYGTGGTLNQSGGTVNVAGALVIGTDGGTGQAGTGTYNLSGASTLNINSLLVGAGSSGTATQSSGVFNVTGGTATFTTVSLGVNSIANTGTVNGDIGVFNQSAGSVTATTLNVGESSGGIGLFFLSGSGSITGNTLNVGDNAGSLGFFNQTGTSTATFTNVNIGNSAGATGTFTQSSGNDNFESLKVGFTGAGAYVLSSGSLTTSSDVFIGGTAGSSGLFTQSGGTVTTTNVAVGGVGSGSYILSGGQLTITTGGELDIALSSGAGTFTLSGGEVDAADGVFVAGSTGTGVFNYNGGALGSTTAVTVGSNGFFNQNTSFTPGEVEQIHLEAGSVYNLNAGTLQVGGDITAAGNGILASTSAIFNFAGGAVQVTGSPLVDPLNGSVTSNSAIDTTNGNATLSGVLTGSGVLTLVGGNALNLTGNSNSSGWGVNVLDGVVNVMAADFPMTGNVTLASTGTFDVTTAGANTLGGTVSGSGNFIVNFGSTSDSLELTAPAGLTGTSTTTLTGGGTLQVLSGTLGAIGQTGGTSQLEIGAGTGSGAVTIAGPATYTGLTTVNPGYTLAAASLAGSVTNGGQLGVYSGGAPAGTLTIGGTLDSTGALVERLVGSQADYFDITGAGTTTIDKVVLGSGSVPGTGTFIILHTLASGDLAPFTTEQLSANRFISVTVQTSTLTTNQDLELISTARPTTSIAGLVLTPNQASVAAVLNPLIVGGNQSTAFYGLLNGVGPNSASNTQLALNLEQLTPESLQYAPNIAYENATFMVQNVNNFETNIHHNFDGFDTSGVGVFLPGFDSGLGHEMQGMLASFHDKAPNGVNYYPDNDGTISDEAAAASAYSSPEPSHETISDSAPISPRIAAETVHLRDPSNHFTEFAGGDITLADLNQNQGAANAPSSKANYTSGDAIVGVGYHMTSNLTAGILMDYNHTDATTDGYGSKTHVDSYSPGLWATYGEKGFFANGLFSFGLNNYSNQRMIPVVNETASSDPSGQQYVGDLDFGYEFHPAYNWTLAPTLGVTYTHVDVDSFTETNAYPADLSVNAQHDDSFRSRLGGYLSYLTHPGQVTLQPTLSAMWQHEYLDQNTQLTSQFNDFPAGAFTINSVTTGRDSALIGGGLTATFDNSMAIFINATADIGSNYQAENIVGGFKGSF